MIKNTVHAPAWTSLTPAPKQYAWLDQDITCQVAVVGGGLSAAMVALRFAQAGNGHRYAQRVPPGLWSHGGFFRYHDPVGRDCLTCLAEEIGPERP